MNSEIGSGWRRSRAAWLVSGLLALGSGMSGGGDPARAEPESGFARISFHVAVNGVEAPEEGRTILECDGGFARLGTVDAGTPRPHAPREIRFVDYDSGRTWQTALLASGEVFSVRGEFSTLPPLERTDDQAQILGYRCRRAKTVLRSNQIDLWYTDAAGLRGSPSIQLLVPDGLVLKVVRNGNYEVVADSIDLDWRPEAPLRPAGWGDPVELPEYRARVAEAYVTTIPIFEREAIRYGELPPNPTDPAQTQRFAGGTVILRRVTLPEAGEDAALFLELAHRSLGDAYDRTGSVFLIPTDRARSFLDGLRDGVQALPSFAGRQSGRTYAGFTATPDYLPPLELLRFITPFGVGHYNREVTVAGQSWEDSVVYRQDVSELRSALRGEVWIGIFIGNYDAGGHEVSLRLRSYPGSRTLPAERPRERWLLPLFDTVNRMEMAGQEYARLFEEDTLEVDFELPEGMEECTLRYVVTGHGGWGNGDEFQPKTNRILVDGELAGTVSPWRSDCATYRRWNPASGNFWNGLSSSDFSRSGWCPGAAVSPNLIRLTGLAPGRHRLGIAIPAGPPEGSSFSAWNVSGALLGD